MPRPAEGLTIVLHGVAGDSIASWRYDAASGWWVDERGRALNLDEVQADLLTAIRRTPDVR
jgi:hypothetical protein